MASLQNVDFAYGQRLVLKQISLPIEQGQTLGIIGPNGGGKTTLIRLLLGQHKPTRGQISIASLSPRAAVARGDVVGYLPQNYHAPPDLPINVRQAVTLGLVAKTGLLRRHKKEDLDFVSHLLERVGIADLASRPIGALSGGQAQRAYIARALAPRPKLLLLDEPTTGIDRSGQQRFIEFLQSLKAELNLTMVLVSHDLRAVTSMADTIACLNLTLHCHATPAHLPPDVIYQMFQCDIDALSPAPHVHPHPPIKN